MAELDSIQLAKLVVGDTTSIPVGGEGCDQRELAEKDGEWLGYYSAGFELSSFQWTVDSIMFARRPRATDCTAKRHPSAEGTMKAIVQEGYGSPDALKLREVEMPAAGDDGVMVEVHAASVNALDWHLARGVPIFIRLLEAIGAPKHRIRGVDLAGRVTAVGKNVMRFKPGDEVLGGADTSFAEFTVTTEKRLAAKPAGITFEQAATLPIAGVTALQGLRDLARCAPRSACSSTVPAAVSERSPCRSQSGSARTSLP